MKALLLRDSKLGHSNQVEGLAACISRLTPVEEHRIEVRARRSKRVRRAAVLHLLGEASGWIGAIGQIWPKADDPSFWLTELFGLQLDALGAPDVVLASGSVPAEAGMLIRKATGTKLVLAGDPLGYPTTAMSLVIVHSPRFAGYPNCVFAPVPNTVDPERLPAPRPLRTAAEVVGAKISLFIGGPGSGYHYDKSEWTALGELVSALSRSHGIQWAVSNSKRTRKHATDVFRKLFQAGEIESFIDFRQAGAGSAGALYEADAIVVTEDSRSMMAEAMAARRPVILMSPRTVSYTLGTERIAATAAGGGMAVLPIAHTTPEHFIDTLIRVVVPARSPQDVLTQVLALPLGLPAPATKA